MDAVCADVRKRHYWGACQGAPIAKASALISATETFSDVGVPDCVSRITSGRVLNSLLEMLLVVLRRHV